MKYSKELKIGVFVIVILVMSFFMINYLRGVDIFDKELELSARYSDLEGLTSSAPVFVKGFKAGKVLSVTYEPQSDDFIVTCSVLRDFMIPSDSRMIIYGVDIMGGKGIRIEPGVSDVMASDGDFLQSSSEPALLDGIASGVGPLLEKASVTMDSLTVAVSSVNRLVSDEDIYAALDHLESTLSSVRTLAGSLSERSPELNEFIDNLIVLSGSLNSIAGKADTAVAGISDIVSSVDKDLLAQAISSLEKILSNMNDPDGTVGKLMTDDSVYDSLEVLLNDIDSLVQKIQENPKKYIKISVF